ncbi:MAG: eCIS core domain-containing protein, partial [Polyangia bacterium]
MPGEAPKDRGWALHDRMRMVRAERQSSASQIQRSLTAWRKESGGGAGGAAAQASIPKSGGVPLGADVRKSMEGRLGADLSNVKVHTGGAAASAAEGLRARAFTVGEDVHFGDGEFAPGTKEGDRLLAHELTHVVQGQRSGIQRKADEGEHKGGGGAAGDAKGAEAGGAEHEVSQPGDPAEKEADAVADNVTEGIHGDKKGDKGKGGKGKGKGKDKDKEKKAAHAGAAGDGDGADDGDHGGHGDDAHGGGAHGDAKGGAHGDAKGGAGGEVQQAPPAQISAKLISRKIFRDPKAGAPPAKTGGATNPATANAAGSTPGANPKEAEIDGRITKERAAIAAAGSLGALGAIIAGTQNPGQAAIKLNNTEASVKRATAAFTAAARTDPMMASAQAEFVDGRYGKAVAGQKAGILAAIDKAVAKKGTPAFADVNYGDAQWDATKSMDQSVLLPENLNAGGADASIDVAKQKGGVIKLF